VVGGDGAPEIAGFLTERQLFAYVVPGRIIAGEEWK
jgi:hypothetical protein